MPSIFIRSQLAPHRPVKAFEGGSPCYHLDLHNSRAGPTMGRIVRTL